jgi:hypothetical protein
VLNLLREEEASLANMVEGERRIAIFAAGRPRLERLAATADRCMDASVSMLVDLASEPVPETFGGGAICVDAGNDVLEKGDPLIGKLVKLDAIARERGVDVIANAGPQMIDALAACMPGRNVTLLCQADERDWAVALALLPGRQIALHEAGTEESLRLQRLADEVERIARTLSELTEKRGADYGGFREAGAHVRATPDNYRAGPMSPVTVEDVRSIVRLRRLRERFFPADLFADPAWDMLLDLMVARLEKSAIAVSSLCIAAAVPPTTALRWIKTMTESGLFVRVADPEDGRRVFIELAEPTAAAMMNYLGAAKSQGGLAV